MSGIGAKYAKWDQYVDSDDESPAGYYGHTPGADLDALTGDPDEVAQIRENWGHGTNTNTNTATATTTSPTVANVTTTTNTVTTTTAAMGKAPASQAGSAKGEESSGATLRRDFERWDRFDAEKAVLDLDNEDRHNPDEAPTMLRAEGGSAHIETVEYKKDAEEHRVDVEFDEKTGDLKRKVAERFRTAHLLKEEGNALMKRGSKQAARQCYAKGAVAVEYCVEVLVLASPSMQDKITSLATALHANLAQACLGCQDYAAAVSACDAALALTPGHEKALFRRATAHTALSNVKEALADISALPPSPAAEKLRTSLHTSCEA